jgi:hypothetical protein
MERERHADGGLGARRGGLGFAGFQGKETPRRTGKKIVRVARAWSRRDPKRKEREHLRPRMIWFGPKRHGYGGSSSFAIFCPEQP